MVLKFSIENIPFGDTNLLTLIENGEVLKIAILKYQSLTNYSIKDFLFKEGDNGTISYNKSRNIISIEFTFENIEFNNETESLYATYSIVYENELINKISYPYFIYDNSTFGEIQFGEELTEDQENVKIILDKWITQDSLKVINALTDEHSHIIVNKDRKIFIPNEDRNILLTKDNDSEEITFEIPQVYDGIDLSTKNLGIYYIRPVNDNDPETPQGVTEPLRIEKIENGVIHATWTITNVVTSVPGTLTFAIVAEGDGFQDEYFWQTYPAQFIIEEGIYGKLPYGIEDFSFIDKTDFRNDIIKEIEKLNKYHEQGKIKWQSIASLITPEPEV